MKATVGTMVVTLVVGVALGAIDSRIGAAQQSEKRSLVVMIAPKGQPLAVPVK